MINKESREPSFYSTVLLNESQYPSPILEQVPSNTSAERRSQLLGALKYYSIVLSILIILNLTVIFLIQPNFNGTKGTLKAYFVLNSVYIAICLMIHNYTQWVILMSCVFIYQVLGIISLKDTLDVIITQGFSNDGVITVAILFIVAEGIKETGMVTNFCTIIMGSTTNTAYAQIKLMLLAGFLSLFINVSYIKDVPLASVLIAMLDTWAPRVNISKSKLMLPMAYGLILGGEGSLIGSTLNIVALSQAKESDNWDGDDVRFFEFGYVSLPLFVISIVYVVLLSPYLLKARQQNEASVREAAKDYWAVFYVPEGSWMVGNSIDLSGVTRCPQVTLREVERNLRPIAITDSKYYTDLIIEAGDCFIFSGSSEGIGNLRNFKGIFPIVQKQIDLLGNRRRRRCLFEVVVDRHGSIAYKTVSYFKFRETFEAVIIAIRRTGSTKHYYKYGDLNIRPGDSFLIEAKNNFDKLRANDTNFALIRAVENTRPRREGKTMDKYRAVHCVVGVIVMVVLESVGVADICSTSWILAVTLIINKTLTLEEAKRAIRVDILLNNAAALGVARAIEVVGWSSVLGHRISSLSTGFGLFGVLCGVFLSTAWMSAFVGGTTTALIMLEPVLSLANELDSNTKLFFMVLIFGANSSFITQFSFQIMSMIMIPGSYSHKDIFRFGIILQILLLFTSVGLSILIWD